MMHCVAMQTKQKMAWMTKNTALPGSHVLTTWSTWNYRSINPCIFCFFLHSKTMQNSASTRRKGSDVERHGNKCTLTDANTDSQHLLYLKLLSSLQYSIYTSFSFFQRWALLLALTFCFHCSFGSLGLEDVVMTVSVFATWLEAAKKERHKTYSLDICRNKNLLKGCRIWIESFQHCTLFAIWIRFTFGYPKHLRWANSGRTIAYPVEL